MANYKHDAFKYSIPINEPAELGGSVTMLVVTIEDNNEVRRGAILRRILRNNYGLSRHQAKIGLRAMKFDNIKT